MFTIPIWAFTMPIQAFTLDRSRCSRSADLSVHVGPKRAPNTIRVWLSRLGAALDRGHLPVQASGLASLEVLLPGVRGAIRACPHVTSQRALRVILAEFLRFVGALGYPVARIPSRDLRLPRGRPWRPLVTSGETQAVVAGLLRDQDSLALAVAVILARFGGLRGMEICGLDREAVPGDRRGTIRIRDSKTASGVRIVPLACLAPRQMLDLVDQYALARASMGGDGAWLVDGAGQRWTPRRLGDRVNRRLRRIGNRRVGMHALRHACATWFLVEWWAEWRKTLAQQPGGDRSREGWAMAVLGCDPARVLWALGRLLGHASPEITLEHYVLALDHYEALRLAEQKTREVSLIAAADLLQVSPRWARKLLPIRNGRVPLAGILDAQQRRLGETTSRAGNERAVAVTSEGQGIGG